MLYLAFTLAALASGVTHADVVVVDSFRRVSSYSSVSTKVDLGQSSALEDMSIFEDSGGLPLQVSRESSIADSDFGSASARVSHESMILNDSIHSQTRYEASTSNSGSFLVLSAASVVQWSDFLATAPTELVMSVSSSLSGEGHSSVGIYKVIRTPDDVVFAPILEVTSSSKQRVSSDTLHLGSGEYRFLIFSSADALQFQDSIGTGRHSVGHTDASLVVVPAPGTLALLPLGLLAARRRR